jgi:hypothetical protein
MFEAVRNEFEDLIFQMDGKERERKSFQDGSHTSFYRRPFWPDHIMRLSKGRGEVLKEGK